MKKIYLSLLFLCIGLTLFAQRENKIIVHAEAGAKYDVFAKNISNSGYQFFVSGMHPFYNNLAAGIGAGYNMFNTYYEEFTAIPIYVDVFYRMPISTKFIPFVEAKVGYGIISKERDESLSVGLEPVVYDYHSKFSGGVYIAPSIGVLFPVKNSAISVSVSYDMQRVKRKYEDLSTREVLEQSKFNSKTMALKIGFLF